MGEGLHICWTQSLLEAAKRGGGKSGTTGSGGFCSDAPTSDLPSLGADPAWVTHVCLGSSDSYLLSSQWLLLTSRNVYFVCI